MTHQKMRSIVLVEEDDENVEESKFQSKITQEALDSFNFDYCYKLALTEVTRNRDLMANIGSALGLVANGLDVTTLLSEAHPIEEVLIDHIVKTLCSVASNAHSHEYEHEQRHLEISCYEIIDLQINDLLSSGGGGGGGGGSSNGSSGGSNTTTRTYRVRVLFLFLIGYVCCRWAVDVV